MTMPSFDDPTYEPIHFVYDVESVGLHGEAFAVAFVVFQGDETLEEKCYACQPSQAYGRQMDRDWIDKNLPEIDVNQASPLKVREAFWKKFRHWMGKGANIWADYLWPVDSRFMSACIDDDWSSRHSKGPAPLQDIHTLGVELGLERIKPDNPHHPLSDAKASAAYLRRALAKLS